MSNAKGWIGVDLDGTLAHYDGWQGSAHIGDPVPAMVERVKTWLKEGKKVKIFTARIACTGRELDVVKSCIADWSTRHIGCALEITNIKDYGMITLYDDRCVQVEANTGRLIGG